MKNTETSIFDDLIMEEPKKFIVTYNQIVSKPEERFRTDEKLRLCITQNGYRFSTFIIRNNVLYAIYSKDRKKGSNLTINNKDYMDISKMSTRFADRIKNNSLTFYVEEITDDHMILKLPLRTIEEAVISNNGTMKYRLTRKKRLTDDQRNEINRKYNVDKVSSKVLATQYGVSEQTITKITSKGY